jgi:hypothetical protein
MNSHESKSDVRPERGSRWRHPDFRGTWRIRSVGPRWVVLLPPYPIHGYPNTHSVPRASWPDRWERAE